MYDKTLWRIIITAPIWICIFIKKIKYAIRYTGFFLDFIAAFIFHEAASYAAAKLPSLAKVCGTVLQMTFL